MNKKRLVITSVISIILISLLFIGSTYSIFTTGDIDENQNVYTTGNLNITYTLSEDNVMLEDITPTSVDDSIRIKPYRITVTNTGTVDYKFNVILTDTTASNKIDTSYIMTQVGKYEPVTLTSTTNNILKSDIVVPASSSVDVDVKIFISDSVPNSEIGKNFYARLSIDGLAVYSDVDNNDNSLLIADYSPIANEPNLDTGMIPVLYDDGVWVKADSNNSNNNWYDYENKIWANAVLVSDSSRTIYQTASVGTIIADDDILAFYVWIPRFKYRVWNITRQVGEESDYAYAAYSEGIDIKFESGITSTGNVLCNYDDTTIESIDNLSDICIYDDIDVVTTMSNNSDYTGAWYTHPAFTFGDEELTGFWIGKFETGGTSSEPIVKPDVQALRNQTVSEQFSTSKLFQNYGLSSDIDAHMLTNLEWGAVTYLTHSNYGLCSESKCRDIYFNNSSNYYTGRSSGILFVNNAYTSSGSYSYDGYVMSNDVTKTKTKDISKVASTTGNIYGVYDLSGCSYEHVMGNMLNSLNKFNPINSGDSWNGYSILDKKYYTSYSYGTNYDGQVAFNRARLGDATGEIMIVSSDKFVPWSSENFTNKTYANFVGEGNSWFVRGGDFNTSNTNSYYKSNGDSADNYSFRSSLT